MVSPEGHPLIHSMPPREREHNSGRRVESNERSLQLAAEQASVQGNFTMLSQHGR